MIADACALCKGACCRTLVMSATGIADLDDWIGRHGKRVSGGRTRLLCRCESLGSEFLPDGVTPNPQHGICMDYEGRPQVCRDFVLGSADCRRGIEEAEHLGPVTKTSILMLLDKPKVII